jgi:hypothetical protein
MPSLNTGNAILSNAIAVDSSYNVGIGGAASGTNKLQVTGIASANSFIPTSSTIPSNGMYLPSGNTLGFSTNSSLDMVITAAGNVGIGTNTTPNTRLHVVGSSGVIARFTDGTTNSYIYSGSNVGAFGTDVDINNGLIINGVNQTAQINTAGGTRIFCTSGGNVGIGTGSPASQATGSTTGILDVSDSAGGNLVLHRTGSGDTALFSILKASNGTYIDSTGAATAANNAIIFRVNNTNANQTTVNEAMRITSGGEVQTSSNFRVPTGSKIFFENASGTGNSLYRQVSDGSTVLTTPADMLFVTGASTKMTITNNGSIGAPSGTNIYNASDVRLKRNVTTITNGLDKINALNPVKFNWIDGFETTENEKDLLGFIAQQVQSVIPEAVEDFGNNSVTIGETIVENPLRVNEKFIIPVLVKAIQELTQKVENQQQTINSLINR